ncbi:sulfurtransferase-like selenium metabolism protein YedF [Campylobacter sp. Marseille-Q3452]|uniref:Sulfurtransferase-like selenium metabolism protein YedF n=1 Tax=Campylobacter massiliensis TaxID=2762557 RepID=A0A842J572_9BACT|nr:sulfurtransferase-like selenium metabolism protein YedF [Campylobacter massiliensis]MBC2881725.1 sulfurtransferase-like selenium metabolism protein YedF [Campylobacter massiliensis]
MQIDCRNLACPEPVIKTKNALESLKNGEKLEILVNSIAPKENISRFLKNQNVEFSVEQNGAETKITAVKGESKLELTNFDEFVCEITPKTKKTVVYLNEEYAGSGDVGVSLLAKFLGALLQVEKPEYVICVNNAVKITTNRAHPSFKPLKDLEAAGVKILSCGSCLEAYKLVSDLSVGEMSNAYEVMQILTTHEQIKL